MSVIYTVDSIANEILWYAQQPFFAHPLPIICEAGSGGSVTSTIDVREFEGIQNYLNANIKVKVGTTQSVTVTGQENIIKYLNRGVDGNGMWDLKFLDRCVWAHDELEIDVTMKAPPKVLNVYGSGKIYNEDIIDTNTLETGVWGCGEVDLNINANDIDSILDGYGNKMTLNGEVINSDVTVYGSGEYFGFGLDAVNVDIEVGRKFFWQANAEVRASGELSIMMNGGKLIYKGNATVSLSGNGQGTVISADKQNR